jgi:hypothetical protein
VPHVGGVSVAHRLASPEPASTVPPLELLLEEEPLLDEPLLEEEPPEDDPLPEAPPEEPLEPLPLPPLLPEEEWLPEDDAPDEEPAPEDDPPTVASRAAAASIRAAPLEDAEVLPEEVLLPESVPELEEPLVDGPPLDEGSLLPVALEEDPISAPRKSPPSPGPARSFPPQPAASTATGVSKEATSTNVLRRPFDSLGLGRGDIVISTIPVNAPHRANLASNRIKGFELRDGKGTRDATAPICAGPGLSQDCTRPRPTAQSRCAAYDSTRRPT